MHQLEIKLRSEILMTQAQVLVLLPDHAGEDGRKCRVLWLLHGAGADYDFWLQMIGLDHLMDSYPDLMCVMPNGNNSDYANHFEYANGYNFPAFFFEELMPFVCHTFPASDRREDNYLSGYSMGGAGTLLLGLKEPDAFAAIYPMGSAVRRSDFLYPYRKMTGSEFRRFARNNRRDLPTEYGIPDAGITPKEINMIAKYRTVEDYINSEECTIERFQDAVENRHVPTIHFICGSEDTCCGEVENFLSMARKEGIGEDKVSATLLPGLHHNSAAAPATRKLLDLIGGKTEGTA